ncbi:hypothetical protein FRC17_005907 [Serendipita sp. 399]|nr:hypothetical protein FRC17_005907 [Serendipita sp. 399]
MSISVSYNDFQTPNGALTSEGGPWRVVTSSSELYCWTARTTFCNDYGRCVACQINYASTSLSYNTKYLVNISIPMSQYGNVDTLDYTFAYNLNWASDQIAAGTPLSNTVTVGSSRNTNNFAASDPGWLLHSSSTTSLGDPFTHSGTTSISKSADGNTGYIPITIDFSFTRTAGADCNWYMKGAVFHITNPASSAAGSSSPSATGTVAQVSGASSSLSVLALPAISQQSNSEGGDAAVGTLPSSSASNSASVSSVPIGAIVGGVLGGMALLGVFSLLLFLLYRKKVRELKRGDQDLLAHNNMATSGNGDGDSTKGPMTANPFDPFHTYHTTSPMGQTMSSIEPLHTSTTAIPLPFHPVDYPYGNNSFGAQQQQRTRREGQAIDQQSQRPLSNDISVFGVDAPPPAYSAVHSTPNDHGHSHRGDEDDEEEEYGLTSPSHLGHGSSQVASSARAEDEFSTDGAGVGSEISHQARRRQQERFSAFIEEKNRRSWNLPPIPSNNPNSTTTNTTTTMQNGR